MTDGDVGDDISKRYATMGLRRYPDCFMAYQPVVDLASGAVLFYEALFRTGHVATPRALLDAEREGWIIDVDLYALRSAQTVLQQNPAAVVAVNLSAASIRHFAPAILAQLDDQPALCARIYVEITETEYIEADLLLAFVDSCRARRVRIAQDDYGVKFSTAERARLLRPAVLKIVAPTAPAQLAAWGRTRLHHAAAMATELNAILLVERIETACAELVALRYGASAGQGYAYGRPSAALPRRPGGVAAQVQAAVSR